jgi:hypothetical protein
MKFVISRKRVSVTENKRPCDEAREEELTPLDYRTVKTLEEAKGKVWYKDWLESGENHREEYGEVVCDKKDKTKKWVIEINTLEELIAFQGKYGEIAISDSTQYKEARKEIIIL